MATEKTVAMITVTSFECAEITPGVYADVAETEYCDLNGRNVDRWQRRYPGAFDSDRRRIWRSVTGGTPAPSLVSRALDEYQPSARHREPTYGWHTDERA